jgi:adenylate cyclase
VPLRCPACGSRGAADARFCDRCGTALAPGSQDGDPRTERPAAQHEPSEHGDRRIVTALFADLVDYVRMLAEHDPEVVRARVTRALGTMAAAIERYGGTREKFIGDAVFAVFGWPQAHDDDAVRANLAALAVRDGLRSIGDGAEPMEVRIGIATGEVVAASRRTTPEGDLGLTGEAITTAARIQSLARSGEIVMDAATVAAARGRLATDHRGSVILRGQSTPIELHSLRGEAGRGAWIPYAAPAPGPFVGRARELAALETAIERCRRSGRGGAVVVVGEAGMGKSRLLAAVEDAARDAGFAWTWTENVSYRRGDPYRWARQFAQVAADEHDLDSGTFARQLLFTDDLAPDAVRRLGGGIAAIAREAAFSGWEAEASNMPTDAADVTATLSEVATRYIERLLAISGPRVVVVDDLHWLDPSSAGMVELLVQSSADLPLLVLAGARPGDLPDWTTGPGATRVNLGGLAAPETARLATLVARAAVDAEGARSIHERTGGNPLFVGETVRAFLEDGTLELRDGRAALTSGAQQRVPITLRAVLGARIDALEPASRDVLGVASIIGIAFGERLLTELLGRPLEPGTLAHLGSAALIQPAEDGTWRFAHALIHDAAYAGVLASRRRQLHARLADHLETREPVVSPGQVASHRVAAGDHARAVPLLREAAGFAMSVGAAAEAAAFWHQAADLCGADDPAAAATDRTHASEALEAARALRDLPADPGASPSA